MRRAPYLLALCAALGSLSCSGSSSTATTILRPQLVSVSPDDFLGTFTCLPDFATGGSASDCDDGATGTDPNAVKSYVATLIDVTEALDGGPMSFDLPSSPPTPCTQPVTFSYVVTNHRYLARIEAYSGSARSLVTVAPGAPLLTGCFGQRVKPVAVATCGGYPSTPGASGAGGAGGGAGAGGDAGATSDAGGTAGALPGVVAYDTLTQIPHDCRGGLAPIPPQ